MDRLSSYASRESETESPEDRQKNEQEAVTQLFEKLRVSKEQKQSDIEKKPTAAKQTNGEEADGDKANSFSKDVDNEQPKPEPEEPPAEANGDEIHPKKHRGIPANVKLYEIFYDQVTHLVNAQRLQIHDTIALLVSLGNLALYDP